MAGTAIGRGRDVLTSGSTMWVNLSRAQSIKYADLKGSSFKVDKLPSGGTPDCLTGVANVYLTIWFDTPLYLEWLCRPGSKKCPS